MAKPICVVYYNPQVLFCDAEPESIYNVTKVFQDKFPDYYVLCVPSYKSVEGEAEMIELKVFYEKDFVETKYEELKILIEQEFKKN